MTGWWISQGYEKGFFSAKGIGKRLVLQKNLRKSVPKQISHNLGPTATPIYWWLGHGDGGCWPHLRSRLCLPQQGCRVCGLPQAVRGRPGSLIDLFDWLICWFQCQDLWHFGMIRILRSVPWTSGYGFCLLVSDLQDANKKYFFECLFIFEGAFTFFKYKSHK